ncbi:MAG: hypothetical protein JKY01_06705, partial [Pseudomonadales bacterium]|nr:hypothetical protein [Pseudomonadales bacterium]
EVAHLSDDDDFKRTALFQAAELYKGEAEFQRAIQSYREYAHTYPLPLADYFEATYSLSALYGELDNQKNADFWRRKTISASRHFSKQINSERVRYIVAEEALILGKRSGNLFERYRLVEPLKANLKNKKSHMLAAVKYFGIAARSPFAEIKADAIHQIGGIYANFSQALLGSERPASLSDIELEQYEILLEDQAFPFEEKAIEMYERNLRLASAGGMSQWIKLSYSELEKLYPARYMRKLKVDAVINGVN